MMKNKKAAIELSIGTIVIIVIAMSMLILGIVLVRQVMCAGIVLTEEISSSTENEIKNLFGSTDYGVRCLGSGNEDATIGSGGERKIFCVVKPETQAEYQLKVEESKLVNGRIPGESEGNSLSDDFMLVSESGTVTLSPPDEETVTVAILDVPREIDKSLVFLLVGEYVDGAKVRDHQLYIKVEPVGSFTAAIC